MKLLKPKFWDQNYFTVASLLLLPLSFLYKFFLFLRKKIYSQKRFPIKIICVGNIYVGGTGKTPIVLNICKILKEMGQNPIIIRKEYKNHEDEISIIKKNNKIITAKKRKDGIKNAIEKKYNFAVLDDGLQDLNIKKDLNIVCFHSSQKIGNGFVIPSGPLREGLDELQKCQVVLINGKKDIEFEQKLKVYNPMLEFFYYRYIPKNIDNLKNKKLIAFAGIGNPINFFDLLKENHLNVLKEVSFPDHYNYNDKDLYNLQKLEDQYKAKLITTEKDFLRMNSFIRKKYSYIKIEIKFDDEEGFYNRIKKIVL